MKQLLYIGNNIKFANSTVLQQLSSLLSKENYKVAITSSKENQVLRLIDMILSVFKNRKKVAYVLIDTYSTKNFYYALICSQLCRVFNLKYIPILHGGNLPYRLDKSKKLSKLVFKYSYKNIAPSNYLKAEFKKRGFKVDYIPNILEIEKYSFTKRTVIAPKLLYVRSFSHIYNPTLAIKVLRQLKTSYPEAELCMVGPDKDGSLAKCKELVAKYKLDYSVTFTGKLSKEEWHQLSKKYDIFINTTNFDNTPVSVMEAMALGLPIVSTNVGGIPYLLEHEKEALLVAKESVNEMTQAIIKLLTMPDNAFRIAKNARNKVECFDWSRVKESWLQVLK